MIIESFSIRRFFVSILYFSMCRSFLVTFYSSLLFGSSVVFSSPESPLPCSSLWLGSFIMEFQFSVSLHSPKNILKIHIWLQWVLLSRFLLRLFSSSGLISLFLGCSFFLSPFLVPDGWRFLPSHTISPLFWMNGKKT